jgi:hypothetical protein
LLEVGIDIKKIISKLEDDGIAEYIKSFDKLMDCIAKKSLVHDVMTEK